MRDTGRTGQVEATLAYRKSRSPMVATTRGRLDTGLHVRWRQALTLLQDSALIPCRHVEAGPVHSSTPVSVGVLRSVLERKARGLSGRARSCVLLFESTDGRSRDLSNLLTGAKMTGQAGRGSSPGSTGSGEIPLKRVAETADNTHSSSLSNGNGGPNRIGATGESAPTDKGTGVDRRRILRRSGDHGAAR
jgi:hypothetical protein